MLPAMQQVGSSPFLAQQKSEFRKIQKEIVFRTGTIS